MTAYAAQYATNELGVGLVVDLRNSDEAQRDGRGPLADSGVEYRHFPFLEGRGIPPFTGGDVVERLSSTYQWVLNNSGPLVAEAVSTISDAVAGRVGSAAYGAVFHCSAGKDRTGIVAALVLEVLGVDRETHHRRLPPDQPGNRGCAAAHKGHGKQQHCYHAIAGGSNPWPSRSFRTRCTAITAAPRLSATVRGE